jgi:predicted O-methyltransferase YrrM
MIPDQATQSLAERHACRVTVSIPYFQCKPYICRAVESILGQTYDNLILVVVNDGDPAPPWDQLAHIDDPRLVRCDLAANHGRYFADAVVLNATTDPYFLVQDADDWSEPRRVALLLEVLLKEDADGAISAAYQYGIENDIITKKRRSSFAALKRPLTEVLDHPANHTGLFKAEALRNIGGYYGGFRIGYDTLIVNLLLMTGKISYVNKPLYNTLLRPDSLTHHQTTGKGTHARLAIAQHLQNIYREIYKVYTQYLHGDVSKENFMLFIRQTCHRNISKEDKKIFHKESEKLRNLLIKSYDNQNYLSKNIDTYSEKTDSNRVIITKKWGRKMEHLLSKQHMPWNAWTISKHLARALHNHLEKQKPRRILEIGSGISTVFLAHYAARHHAKVVSLEHDKRFYDKTKQLLVELDLTDCVELRIAPLIWRSFANGLRYPWYHALLKGTFDFVFVDSPPLRYGRQATLFALWDHLEPRWELWLKDGKRRHEHECIELWNRYFTFSSTLCDIDYRGVWLLSNTLDAVQRAPSAMPKPAERSLIWSQTAQHRLIELSRRMGQVTEERSLNLGFGYLYYGLTRIYKPEVVVCIGSYRGFSPVCFAMALADNQKGKCYFIEPGKVDDYWHQSANTAWLERTFGIHGWWQHIRKTSQQVIAEGGIPEPIDVLLIDGDHSYEGVKFDFDHFGRQVRIGGLIFLHDSRNVGKGFTKWEVKKFLEAEVYGKATYQTFLLPFSAGLTLVQKLE